MSQYDTATAPDLVTIAGDVTRELGLGWTVAEVDTANLESKRPAQWVHLAGPDGAILAAYLDAWYLNKAPRIEWRGIYPKTENGSDYGPRSEQRAKCTTAASRPPAAIARELQARVLKVYVPQLAEAIARRNRDRLARDRRDVLAAGLALVLDVKLPKPEPSSDRVVLRIYREGSVWGDVQVYADSVSIELRGLSPDLARAICERLREVRS